METSLIGEMDMLREMGVRPSFPEMARRCGMDRHAVAKHWKEGVLVAPYSTFAAYATSLGYLLLICAIAAFLDWRHEASAASGL